MGVGLAAGRRLRGLRDWCKRRGMQRLQAACSCITQATDCTCSPRARPPPAVFRSNWLGPQGHEERKKKAQEEAAAEARHHH